MRSIFVLGDVKTKVVGTKSGHKEFKKNYGKKIDLYSEGGGS